MTIAEGGGGKSGGSQRSPVESPNTLRSKATGYILDVLSEGPIKGFVNGYRSVILNDTQLQATNDDSFNFKGVNLTLMAGLADQAPVEGFEQTTREVVVGVQVKAGTPITRTVSTTPLSALRVTIRIPALAFLQSQTGDLGPTSVSLRIDVQASGEAYQLVTEDVISGKCVSPYEKSYLIPLWGKAPWNIRLTRVTPDSESSSLSNDTYWASYTEVLDWPISYAHTAYCALAFDAEQFGSALPQRQYEIDGLMIKIPSNYDPIARTYTGIWDGTFKIDWTNNPAWVFYDLLTNTRYGLGQSIPGSQVDKWALYSIAQYCDELVPDGVGGTEPRFVFNGVLNTQDDAYNVLQTVAACFRGMAYYGAGLITATQDRPAQPVKLVTNANVVGGQFVREGTGFKARHTIARVLFNDQDDSYRPSVEQVLSADLARRGPLPVDVVALGTTKRTQARRIGRWLLDSERAETQTISYRAGLDHADLRPGDIILVADRWYAGLRMGGRIASATTTSVTVDSAPTLEAGQTYKLRIITPLGDIVERDLTNAPGKPTVLTFNTALATLPQTDSVWIVAGSALQPEPYRVLSIAQVDPHIFEITATQHDPTKYARIEGGIQQDPGIFTTYLSGAPTPPTDLSVREYLYTYAGAPVAAVTLSWTHSADPRAVVYEVEAIRPTRVTWEAVTGSPVTSNSIDLFDLEAGTASFRVRAVDQLGRKSAWATLSDVALDGLVKPPGDVTSLAATGVIRGISISWVLPFAADLAGIEVWENTSNNATGRYFVGEALATGFLRTGLEPAVTRWYWVRSRDTSGNRSAFIGPVSATSSLLVATDIQNGILDTAKFASSIKPIALPATSGELVNLRTADQIIYPQATLTDSSTGQTLTAGRLYRWNGTAWVAVVSAAEISGQITSDQIASLAAAKLAGQITTTQITDGAISTPKLAAGSVTAAVLAAGAVTTSKLAVVPQTLNPDPYFQDESAWAYSSGGVPEAGWYPEAASGSNAPATLGVPQSVTIWSGAWTGTGENFIVSTFRIPVTVGEKLAIKARGLNYGNRNVGAFVNFHTAADAYLSSLGFTWGTGEDPSDKEVQGTVPATAAYALVVVYLGAGVAWDGIAAISAITVFRPATASMVVDGAITADKVAANAVMADKIAANAITAGKIAAGAISSAQIAAGEIKAVNLASETLITQAAQLGTAVVTTAKINDLAVNTIKIADNSLSTFVAQTSTTDKTATGPNYYSNSYDMKEVVRVTVTLEGDGKVLLMHSINGVGTGGPSNDQYGGGGGNGGGE